MPPQFLLFLRKIYPVRRANRRKQQPHSHGETDSYRNLLPSNRLLRIRPLGLRTVPTFRHIAKQLQEKLGDAGLRTDGPDR